MKVVFYAADKPRELMIARNVSCGVQDAGDEFELRRTADYGKVDSGDCDEYQGPTPDTDVAMFFGVKGKSRAIMADHLALGKSTVYLDKGITRRKGANRHTEYTRVCINAQSPIDYMLKSSHSSERFDRLDTELEPRRNGVNILVCGSSSKYHMFHGIPHPTEYAESIVKQLKQLTDMPAIYRPKPTWPDATPIRGSIFSQRKQSLIQALNSAHCLVTHGSGAAFYAICMGVPVISLGPSIARPISETDLRNVNDPYWPSSADRKRWANATAWTQFTLNEFKDGFAWGHLRQEIIRQRDARKDK